MYAEYRRIADEQAALRWVAMLVSQDGADFKGGSVLVGLKDRVEAPGSSSTARLGRGPACAWNSRFPLRRRRRYLLRGDGPSRPLCF
jgi:hypothetical protein